MKGNLDESSSVKIIDQMLQDDQIIAMKVISPEQLADNFGQERNEFGAGKSSTEDQQKDNRGSQDGSSLFDENQIY